MLSRTELLVGEENINKLKKSHVIVFGIGGVGGFAAEALARAGIGEISLVDFDVLDISNINRQIIASHETIGEIKVDIMKKRIMTINPEAKVHSYPYKVSKTNILDFFKSKKIDYIIDAIDLISCKLDLIEFATLSNIKIISCMGTGNRLEPTMFKVTDIKKTKICPIARTVRKELKHRGVNKLKVVFSEEIPKKPKKLKNEENSREKRCNVGSISFVPPVAGMILASEVIKDIFETKAEK